MTAEKDPRIEAVTRAVSDQMAVHESGQVIVTNQQIAQLADARLTDQFRDALEQRAVDNGLAMQITRMSTYPFHAIVTWQKRQGEML